MTKYCLDTNVFVEGWNKYYAYEFCPKYWEILDQFAMDGRIFSPIEVKREIEKTDDALLKWIKDKDYYFKEITPKTQEILRDILTKYERLVDSTKQRSIADPWVIATAVEHNATVVTKETPAINSRRRIKIPDVCIAMNVRWIDDFKFTRELGIKFEAAITI